MLILRKIENEVRSLPRSEYADFRKWFFSHDNAIWDREIEEDSENGSLDFLISEAVSEKGAGELKKL